MIYELKEDIDMLKTKLNVLIEKDGNINKDVILRCSEELDRLVVEFYKLYENDKKCYRFNVK